MASSSRYNDDCSVRVASKNDTFWNRFDLVCEICIYYYSCFLNFFLAVYLQIVLTISFVLKKGFIVAILSALSTTLTWTFGTVCKDTFGQSYSDAALLQTSELDGWDVEDETSMVERERYRKWLVDCHKASYVPICVNAEDNFLTSEPAGKANDTSDAFL